MINDKDMVSEDLSLFAGQVKDMAPGNLPKGTSPACNDMMFSGQWTATRAALAHCLLAALGTGDILSHNDYPQQDGSTETIVLYEDGTLWTRNVQSGATNNIGTVTPGVRFKSVAAFDHFFMAFRSLGLTSSFTEATLCGGDVPRYINPLGHMWRVTSDAPGGGFSVAPVTIAPEDVVLPGAFVVGPAITSITLGGAKTITITVPHEGTRTITYYTTAAVVLASTVTLVPGQIVQLYGINWAGPQWPNGVAVATVTDGTHFTIAIAQSSINVSATQGIFAYVPAAGSAASLSRNNNIVTAYLAGTSPGSPTQFQPGWYVSLIDTQATANSAVPISGEVPFTQNELFQAIFPSTTSAVPQWLNGAQMTFYTYAHHNGGAFNYDYPGDGFNEILPTPLASYTFAADLGGVMLTPNGNPSPAYFTTLPGAPNTYGVLPWQLQGVNAAGDWSGHSYTPYAGATTDVAAIISGYVYLPAGESTFLVMNDDGVQIGFEKGVTFVSSTGNHSGGQFNPQPHTLSALNGYPLVYAENASTNYGGVNVYVGTVTVSVATAGVYGVELDYVNWEGNATLVFMNYVSGTPVPMQPTVGPASAKVVGDGVGNIHVTLPTAIEALPIGAWLYLYLNPPSSSNIVDWTITSNGTGSFTTTMSTFSANEAILLGGFTSVSNPEPTGWNGQTVTITSVTTQGNGGQLVQFLWNGPAGSGTTTTGTATPQSAQYPQGWIQVTQVISPTEFVYYAINNTETLNATGTVYDYFGSLNTQQALTAALPGQSQIQSAQASSSGQASASGIVQGFQILSINTTTTPNSLTYYQSGFNDTYTGTHQLQLQPQSQIAAGPRNMFVFFINEDGGTTPGAYPILVNLNGGTQFAQVTLPIGPPGTVARGTAWTTAYGALYFVLGAGNVPASGGNGPVIVTGTIINDNTTINTIIDFSDVSLENGILVGPGVDAVAEDYGDLTSMIVLPPCIGVIEYNEALAWWGELNCYPNHSMVNMGFDGGYDGTLAIGSTAKPLGWNTTGTVNGVVADNSSILVSSTDGLGFALQFNVTQGYGGYGGTMTFVFWSPTAGLISTATAAVNNFNKTAMGWVSAAFNNPMPNSVPADLQFAIYVATDTFNGLIWQGAYQDYYGAPIVLPNRSYVMRFMATVNTSTKKAVIDELEIIDAHQPVLNNQIRLSYVENGFGYDNENGFVVGLDTPDFISALFLQRAFMYALTEGNGELHCIQANAALPSDWSAKFFARECGCSGPDALANGQSVEWWMGRFGVHIFDGAQPKKISQFNNEDFETTNWNAAVNSCMAYDGVQRNLWMSFPTGGSTNPNQSYMFNFRLNDSSVNVPDPIHVSSYTGKILATDLSMKQCPISIPFNSLAMSTQQTLNGSGFAKVMTFGGGKYGPVMADAVANAAGGNGDLNVSVTPKNATDFVFVAQSQNQNRNPVTGFTQIGNGVYAAQATSTNPLTFDQANLDSPPGWSAVAASFASDGIAAFVRGANVDFGTYPEPSYTPVTTVDAGDAIIVSFSLYTTQPPVINVSDSANNSYGVYQNTQFVDGIYQTAYLAVALGCAAGSTTITITTSNIAAVGGQGFAVYYFVYSGISGPVGFGQLYQQDYFNYPPTNRAATTWNAIDADYGTIPWGYTTYAFFSHDTELQSKLGYYTKLFGEMGMHVSGVGFLNMVPLVDSLTNPWTALAPWTLQIKDPGIDYTIGLRVHGDRMFLQFSGTPIPMAQGGDGDSSALWLTHLYVSARKDNVFPNRNAF